MPLTRTLLALLTATALGCGGGTGDTDMAGSTLADDSAATASPRPGDGDDGDGDGARGRPAERRDTIAIEGMPEPMTLRLFTARDDFALPFSAYVPEDMAPEIDGDRSVHITAVFGGQRSPDAFLHVYVFEPGTDRQAAIAEALAYRGGRGIPVSQGIEPIADPQRPPGLAWADTSYHFRYQADGEWFVGNLGIGRHDGRFYQLVRHYPAEYGDGFAPRADLILQTWLWADGERLIR